MLLRGKFATKQTPLLLLIYTHQISTLIELLLLLLEEIEKLDTTQRLANLNHSGLCALSDELLSKYQMIFK